MTSPTVGLIFYLLYLVSLLLRRERRGFSGTEDISHSYIYGWGGYLYKGRNWAAEILAIAKGIQMISELQLAILESDSAAAWHLLLQNADISNPYLIKMGWLYWRLQDKDSKHVHHPEAHTQRRQSMCRQQQWLYMKKRKPRPLKWIHGRPSHKVDNDSVGRALERGRPLRHNSGFSSPSLLINKDLGA